jgi:hypothetical protein
MADNSIKTFRRRMQRRGEQIQAGMHRKGSVAALRILSTVIPATPVDTGRARANWQTSIGAPIRDATTQVDQSGTSTITKGRSVVESRPAGSTIYITNNVPYIELLNQGYSRQAPANFVLIAIRAAIAGMQGVRLLT